jgi:putative ABC transport system permease protein
MFLFLKLAFNNIIKNRRTTFTVLIAVFISVLAMEFTIGYVDGFKLKLINEALEAGGHMKIYNAEYYNNLDFAPVEKNIAWSAGLEKKLASAAGAKSIRPEINFGAIANSEYASQETMVQGIDYSRRNFTYERKKKSVIQGHFIENDKDVLVGVKMAQLLKLKPGDSLILMGMDQYGGINAVEGTVAGIFRNYNPNEEEGLVVCALPFAQKLLALQGEVTEIFVNIGDPFIAETAAKNIQAVLGTGMAVIPWQKGQEMIKYALDSMDIATIIMAALILFVAGLGIINSFLMNTMGRLPEFGVMRAMGISRRQLFMLITTESFIQGVLGTIAGLIPGIIIVYYFQLHPINYEAMGKMLGSYTGLDAMIGTALNANGVIVTSVTGILISVLASVYPAMVAINKKPVDILRVLE